MTCVSDVGFCCLLRYRAPEVLLQSPTYSAAIGNATAFQTMFVSLWVVIMPPSLPGPSFNSYFICK